MYIFTSFDMPPILNVLMTLVIDNEHHNINMKIPPSKLPCLIT